MDASLRLRFVQHDKAVSFRALFCVISICILLNWFLANKTVISSAPTETFFTEANYAIPRSHLTRCLARRTSQYD